MGPRRISSQIILRVHISHWRFNDYYSAQYSSVTTVSASCVLAMPTVSNFQIIFILQTLVCIVINMCFALLVKTEFLGLPPTYYMSSWSILICPISLWHFLLYRLPSPLSPRHDHCNFLSLTRCCNILSLF